MSRLPHAPTEAQRAMVKAMSGYGVPQEDIATVLDIAKKTLLKHYRRELDLGIAQANARIGQTLFDMATGGNVAAAIFWAKSRMGWREKQEIEITAKSVETMSDAELETVIRRQISSAEIDGDAVEPE